MLGRKLNIDRIAALIVLAVCAVFWWQLGFINTKLDKIFPQFVIISLAVLSGILLIKSFIKPESKAIFTMKHRGMVALGAALLVLWVVLIDYIGFLITSIAMFAILSWIMQDKQKRTVKAAISSVLVGAILIGAVYLLFAKLLMVPLPKGTLFM